MYKFNKTIGKRIFVQKSYINHVKEKPFGKFLPCKIIPRDDYPRYKKGSYIVYNSHEKEIHFINALNINRRCCEKNEKIAILELDDNKSVYTYGFDYENKMYTTGSVLIKDVLSLREFVRKIQTEYNEDLLKIIDRFPSWITHLKTQDQTPEILTCAVKSDGLTLRSVKIQTYDLCKHAVQNNGLALQYVDEQFLTEEIYTLAIENNPDALEFIDEENQTEQLCYQAINLKPYALRHVKNQNNQMCMYAINKNPFAISVCESQTVQMCKHAIDMNAHVYNHIDRNFKTDEMYEYVQKKLRKM